MKLYFSPLACSLAAHIVSRELDLPLERVQVDLRTQRTADGSDYRAVNPLGMVPALVLPGAEPLTENAAILQFLAAQRPSAGLAPSGELERARLHKWLSFVGTELHKVVYLPLLDEHASDAARAESLQKAPARLAYAASALSESEYLLGRFSVADAYLFTILHWSQVTPIVLADYPPLAAFMQRMKERPAVAAALREELAQYAAVRVKPKPESRARPIRELMAAYNDVFLRRDDRGLEALVHDECVIENTDGMRHVGKTACVELWRSLALDPALHFEVEQVTTNADGATITWALTHGETRVSGVNLMRVRDGRIVGARGYLRPTRP